MYAIAVNKSQEFFIKCSTFLYIFSTTTKGFDFDDESMFFRRRPTLSLGGAGPYPFPLWRFGSGLYRQKFVLKYHGEVCILAG